MLPRPRLLEVVRVWYGQILSCGWVWMLTVTVGVASKLIRAGMQLPCPDCDVVYIIVGHGGLHEGYGEFSSCVCPC